MKQSMVVVFIAVCILAGIVGGYGAGYVTYGSKIRSYEAQTGVLTSEVSKLNSTVSIQETQILNLKLSLSEAEAKLTEEQAKTSELNSQISILKTEVTDLQADLSGAKTQISNYENQISSLELENSRLQSDLTEAQKTITSYETQVSYLKTQTTGSQAQIASLQQMMNYYRQLTDNVTSLYELLYSYTIIPDAFKRTLNDAEIKKTASAVSAASLSPTDSWSSYQRIYNYVASNIKFAEDIDMPYPSKYWVVDFNGFNYTAEFSLSTSRNYIQTPELTLEIKQGDCDDQAILTYAMMTYYAKYIANTEYKCYLADIEFSATPIKHLAVILPAHGGELCVIDPVGKYLTSTRGVIASKPALSELQAYSNHWASQPDTGAITNMKIFVVNVVDGSYTLVASGTLTQVATTLS